jgi:hypothetical protein
VCLNVKRDRLFSTIPATAGETYDLSPDSLMSGSTIGNKATLLQRAALFLFVPPYAAIVALLAGISVLAAIDLAHDCTWSASGPGLTFDEGLNVEGGVYIVESLIQAGLGALHPATWNEIFNAPNYYPDYPPLGRLHLGLANAVLFRICGSDAHQLYVITYARTASALAFGALALLIAWFTGNRAGKLAGIIAGLSLILMPRVFGHAHLASVETMMNLTFTSCLLGTLSLLAPRPVLRARDGVLPGCLLGLALLTKVQAVFLPPILVVWILWNWRWRGVVPLAVLAGTSFLVFLLGWPWLWPDPFGRTIQYFASTTQRTVLYCFYLGERFADRNVPWHYPFVMFLATMPVAFILFGFWGAWLPGLFQRSPAAAERPCLTPRENQLLLGGFLLPLLVFALPGVPVYDGERLFLVVSPIFAIWIGLAAARAWELSAKYWHRSMRYAVAILVIGLPLGNMITMSPCQLSTYSLSLGGLYGASRLGFEQTYWGDSVTPEFLASAMQDLPVGDRVGVAPVLHPLTLNFMQRQSMLRYRPDLTLVAYDDKQPDVPRRVLLIHRRADPWSTLLPPPPGTKVLRQTVRQGVVLAELLELPASPESR